MDRKQIEDIYPLSPMQQGMLFDTIYLEGTGIYVERFAIQLTGKLDLPAFEHAWQKTVARHAILRTLFLWENRDTPLQVVRNEAFLSLKQSDWRHFSPDSHQVRLDQFLDSERQNEFDLKQAPLLRPTLIRLAEETYCLALIFHHIILDRWSLGLLLNDLFALYNAEQTGENLRLSPTRPFSEYIGWLQNQDTAALERFWRENLEGFTAPTPFNIETNHRPTIGEATYKQAETWLSTESVAQLSAFANQNRLTLNTIVQGAWALLLHHYSGESDLVFGATVAGRPAEIPGVESIVGLFINTLPVRVQVSANNHLVDWLQKLQAHMVNLQQVSHTPLVDVTGWSDISAGSPLFESLIVFQNIPSQSLSADTGLQVSGVGVTIRGQMAYPLTVTVNPNVQGKMWLQITYEEERFESQAIQRLTQHLKNLLENMTQSMGEPATGVPFLSQTEQTQLLDVFSRANAKTAVSAQFVHQLIEQQATRTPDALALTTIKAPERPSFFLDAAQEMPEETLTYAELNSRANQLAHHLATFGVGPEKVVALHRTRSAETLICMLAVLKAGGVFLPLDPEMPASRLAHILADAQPVVVLTDEQNATVEGFKSLCPEQIAAQIGQHPTHDLERPLSPENSAYLIYTSGTTGLPKGTLIPHRAFSNHAQTVATEFALSSTDRVLQFAALSFDVALEEIFPTWLSGAALLLRPLDVPALDEFNQLVANERLSVLNIPAPYWHEWVAEIERTPLFTPAESLRLVVVGSDKVMMDKLTRWHNLMPKHIRLLNGYGPTEAAVTATLYEADTSLDGLSVVPLGSPLPNVTAYVLDENGRLAPIGVIGELYLGGKGLAHGYLNQPGLSAAAFLPNPFSQERGERLYRTGDLARWLPEGNLAFVGRTDHQVKIRGFRIELEEIESQLAQHDGVQQAVVVTDNDQQRLFAYILPTDLSLTTRSIQTWATQKLPDYMIPSSWMMIDSFPLTNSGKVNRRALPEPVFESTDTYVAPRRDDEEIIAAIWSEVLNVEKIGVHDNFFQLGGHSLRATQIVSRMRQQLDWEVPIRAIFETPTIAGLSSRFAPEPIPDDDEAVMAELMSELDGLSDDDLGDLAAMLDL